MFKILLSVLCLGVVSLSSAQVLNIKSGATFSVNSTSATPMLTVQGSAQNDGNLTLVGSVNSTSDMTLSGTLNAPIGGATLGSGYGQLTPQGTLTLSSATLNVTLTGGYMPSIGASFTLLDGASLSGTFTTVQLPTLTSGVWVQTYNAAAGTYILSVATALPVELLSFTGKNTEAGNLLTWETAHEVNNKGFEVERLNSSSWQSVGFITAHNKASNYQFLDKNPLTTAYYRLRQIDNDGKETLSKVISIQAMEAKGRLVIYPNPVANLLTVENTEAGNFEILNLLGQQVLTGKTTQRLDVSALPQGTYILKVGAEQAKFVKQ